MSRLWSTEEVIAILKKDMDFSDENATATLKLMKEQGNTDFLRAMWNQSCGGSAAVEDLIGEFEAAEKAA